MNKKLVPLILLLILLITGCSSKPADNTTGNAASDLASMEPPPERTINIDKLEVYHFHGTHQCYSCITVGDYAEETIKTYFADELKSGKIVFSHINGELRENRELVIKYQVTGSSLWLGTYKQDGTFSAEQNVKVWYKISDKKQYMEYLKEVIEQKLRGE